MHNFNVDNEDSNMIKDFAYQGLVINSNGACSKEVKRRLRLRRAAMEDLEKITRTEMYL